MNISERDKKILMIIVPVVVVLGYWFLLLTPKREAASVAAETLATEQAQLAEAQAQQSTVRTAKTNFARDYAAVVALGKAIPTSVDMPSLLVQLEEAAQGTGIALDGVTMGERTAAAEAPPSATAPTPGAPDPGASSPPTAPSGQPAQSAPGAAAGTAQEAADTASTPPPTADPTGTATTTAPTTGALESVSLEFKFTGDFFELADFFHRMKRFVYVKGEDVRVRGRLMTIDGVEYTTDADTFPALAATVQATVYLTPKAEGVTAGATPAGPQPASATAAPVATASSGSSSPTPTAAATP